MNKMNLLEGSIESTIKSISKKDNFSCVFEERVTNFSDLNQNSFLNHKITLPTTQDCSNARAVGDLAALYLTYHDSDTHRIYHFDQRKTQKLFDDFEKSRLIILGSRKYLGIKNNLKNFVEKDVKEIVNIWDLPLLLIQRSLAILTNIKTATFKNNLTNKITDLEKELNNQEGFAKIVLKLIDEIEEEKQEDQNKMQDVNQGHSKEKSTSQENSPSSYQADDGSPKNDNENKIETQKNLPDSLTEDSRKIVNKSVVFSNASHPKESSLEFVSEYKIFTKKHDQIVKASDLADNLELERLRSELDLKIKDLEKISHKLKAKLKRKLLSKKIIFNEYNKEDGLIDPRKLTRVIINPLKRNNYLQVMENNYQDVVVSFLIDNSGSMRGLPIIMSAMACEVIVQILERFSIKTEILGFTTSRWHGGKSKQLWQISNGAKNPGRVSDLCHIIYKSPDQSLKRSRSNLALMLKEGILKENIDGEALLWATKRLNQRSENRKILIVISDGAPVDDSTTSCNNKDILGNHLHHVIANIEKKSTIELAAIGIGHDVGNFYHNSTMIKNLEDLGDSMIDKMCDLL